MRGTRALFADRAIQAAIHKEAGPRFEGDRLDRVAVVASLVADDRVQRRALGQRIELRTDENLLANRGRPRFPLVEIRVRRRHPRELRDRFRFGLIVALAENRFLVGRRRIRRIQAATRHRHSRDYANEAAEYAQDA